MDGDIDSQYAVQPFMDGVGGNSLIFHLDITDTIYFAFTRHK